MLVPTYTSPTQSATPAPKDQASRVFHVLDPINRRQVETFIQERFYQEHQAQVHSFADNLLVLTDRQQQAIAAMGYQSAANRYLFLEQYLDQHIEQVLAIHGCGYVQRNQILEVGNLASVSSGSTRRLILSLISYFYQQGFRWLVITITPKVHNSFQKLGIDLDLIPLAEATPQRLLASQDYWGSYYDEKPMVYAGNIEKALNRFNDNPLLAALINQGQMPIADDQVTLSLRG